MTKNNTGRKETENKEWLDSLRLVLNNQPADRTKELLGLLQQEAQRYGIDGSMLSTPYVNTIPPEEETEYPGDLELEQRITG